MQASEIQKLQDWYLSQCDADWEHSYGIKIETIDNPGWKLTIDLEETSLASRPFEEREHNYNDEVDWFLVQKKGLQFVGRGGPKHLSSMINIFLEWAAQ